MKASLALTISTIVAIAGAKTAAAESEGTAAAAIVVPLFAADAAFAVHDVVVAAQDDSSSRTYAFVEALLTTPQAAVSIALVSANWDNTRENQWVPRIGYLTLAAATTGLAIHGIWSFATSGAVVDKPKVGSRSLDIAPSVASDGKQTFTGMAVFGRF
jgi:hypothetical protein